MKRFTIPGDGVLSDGVRTVLVLGEWALELAGDAARRLARAQGRSVRGATAARLPAGEPAP
jgi:hypothetical protein